MVVLTVFSRLAPSRESGVCLRIKHIIYLFTEKGMAIVTTLLIYY